MTHISHHALTEQHFEQLYQALNKRIARLDKHRSITFFDELLTPSEKIMLTKRFSAIAMLQQRYSSYRIAATLRMSYSTIAKMSVRFESGKYRHIVALLGGRRKDAHFLDILETLLLAGMPPRGRNRWRALNQ